MQQGHFQQRLNLMDLTLLGLGSIVGSGWLFASQAGAATAGPGAWIAWLVGAIAVTLLGLVYAELGGAIPRAGGTIRYPAFSHGPLIGYLMGFASIISFSSVAGIEVEAMRQYADTWWPALGRHAPTVTGWIVQLVLLIIFFLLNYWSVNVFGKVNTIITAIKFIVPLLTIIVFLGQLHPQNFTSHHFLPYGAAGIESAVSTAGIIFAFLGFQQAVGFSSEAKRPQRDVPLAIILSILLSAALYILLQVSFVGAVPATALANGWASLNYTSPFANLATALGLGWLANIILADAVISPSGTANIYLSATSRAIFAWARTGTFFKLFGRIHDKGVPRPALWLGFVLAIFWTLPFPSWGQLVGVVSSATILTYILGPISAHTFRKTAPNLVRPFRLEGMGIVSPLAFIIASLIIYWTGWTIDAWLLGIQILLFVIYLLIKNVLPTSGVSFSQQLKSTWWLIAYYVLMLIASYGGTFGGANVIKAPWDQIVVALIALVTYNWGINSGVPNPVLEDDLEDDGVELP